MAFPKPIKYTFSAPTGGVEGNGVMLIKNTNIIMQSTVFENSDKYYDFPEAV